MPIDLFRDSDHTSPAFSGFINWQSRPSLNCDVRTKEFFVKSGEVTFAAFDEGAADLFVVAFGQLFEWPENPIVNGNSSTTAEAVLAYYLKHKSMPQNFSGEFCAVIVDRNSGNTTLVTDHTATRPLYYVADNRGVAFSTDASSLLPHCRNPQDLDPDIVAYQLNGFHHLAPSRMMVREIWRVQPATNLTLQKSGTKEVEYWKPEDSPSIRYVNENEYFEHAVELLKKVTIERTPKDAVFGSHLSGGLDSTAITTIACELRNRVGATPPICFAWQPPALPGEAPTSDQKILALCEAFLGLKAQNITPDANTARKYMEFDPAVYEYASDLLSELEVMTSAKNSNVTKILSGWGGDQVFSFSGRHPDMTNRLRFYRHLFKKHFLSGVERKEIITIHPPKVSRFYNFSLDASRRTAHQAQISNIRSQVLSRRMAGWSVVGARHNLQYSYPLLDRRILDFALGIPDNLFRRQTHKRWLMRQTLKGMIPDKLRWYTDKSEPSRVSHSFKLLSEIEETLSEELSNSNSISNWRLGYINQKILNALVNTHRDDDHTIRRKPNLLKLGAFLNSGKKLKNQIFLTMKSKLTYQ